MNTQPKTAIEAFNSKTQSIVKLSKELPVIVLDSLLTIALTDLIESFNIGKTMNDVQVNFTIEAIKTDYYFLKIEELKFCFNEARKGRYGTMYDRIDCAVICGWIEKYLETRIEIAYEQNMKEQKLKSISTVEAFSEIAPALKFSVNEEKEFKKIVKRPELIEYENKIQSIMKEFDAIHEREEKEYYKSGTRFVNYNKKRLTQSEFLELRLKEINEI